MGLESFIEKIPEADREAFKAELGSVVQVKDRETASKLFREHPVIKSEFDAEISRTTAKYDEKFRAEKLPGIVDEEIRKRNPPKDEKDKALEEVRSQLEAIKREALLKDRKATALQKLTEAGLPADLADFALHEDEAVFNGKIDRLLGLKAWGDSLKQEALKSVLGNNPPPKSGKDTAKPMTRAEFEKMSPEERRNAFKAGLSLVD